MASSAGKGPKRRVSKRTARSTFSLLHALLHALLHTLLHAQQHAFFSGLTLNTGDIAHFAFLFVFCQLSGETAG